MSFRNPVVGGGDTLVRQAIQSEGFTLDPESNVSGWRIERDGSAYFTGVTVGNLNYFIDENGDAAFNDVSVNGTLTVGGESLEEILAQRPRGVVANAWLSGISAETSGTTEMGVFELQCELEDGRTYRLATSNIIVNGTVTGDVFRVALRENGSSSPTTSSNLLAVSSAHIFDLADTPQANIDFVFHCDSSQPKTTYNLHPGTYRVLVSLQRRAGSGTAHFGGAAASPATLYLEDLGPLRPNTIVLNSGGGGTTPVRQFVKTYNATWSRAWNGDGSIHSTNGELVQGTYGGDNHRSWIGFNYNQIQSDLSGATVDKVELYLYYDHWYSFDGGTAVIGYHSSTATSAPAYDGNLDDVDELRVPGWGRNVGKWVNITSAGNFTANGWRTGAHTGIVLGPGPSSSTVYYGKARGNTEPNEPRLRITYTK